MNYSIEHCGILIIAAGQSKRLGMPKQLLEFEGKTLINRLIDIVKTAGSFPITLVLGADAEKIKAQLCDADIQVVLNDQWEEGMASSIRVGLDGMLKSSPNIDGIMILVCDQPFITMKSMQGLLTIQREAGLPIAACYYANVMGTPALFHKSLFPELMALVGDVGAKKIISCRESEVAKLYFDQGILDIDTMEDYERLCRKI